MPSGRSAKQDEADVGKYAPEQAQEPVVDAAEDARHGGGRPRGVWLRGDANWLRTGAGAGRMMGAGWET